MLPYLRLMRPPCLALWHTSELCTAQTLPVDMSQAETSAEALQTELAAAGVLVACPEVELQQWTAGPVLPLPAEPDAALQVPSWQAVRSALLAGCVLPLSCQALHDRCQSFRSRLCFTFHRASLQTCFDLL